MYELDADWCQEYVRAPFRAPEQDLFMAVLLQAFNDMRDVAYTDPGDCADARHWLLYDEEDFRIICALAGVEHKAIRNIAIRYSAHLASGGSAKAIPLKGNE